MRILDLDPSSSTFCLPGAIGLIQSETPEKFNVIKSCYIDSLRVPIVAIKKNFDVRSVDIINLPEKHDEFLFDFIRDYVKIIYSVGGKSAEK